MAADNFTDAMRQRPLFTAHSGASDDIQVQPANRPVVLTSHALCDILLVYVNGYIMNLNHLRSHTSLVLLCCNILSVEIFQYLLYSVLFLF